MSPARSSSAGSQGSGSGRGAVTALLALVIAVSMVLLTRSRPSVQPFDPRSSRGDGTHALVLLLEQFGAKVTISANVASGGLDQRVLLLDDRLNDGQRRDLLAFADAGGVVIDADPTSSLHGGPDTDHGAVEIPSGSSGFGGSAVQAESNVLVGDCTIGALQHLRGLRASAGLVFPVNAGSDRCFTMPSDGNAQSGHSFVITRSVGSGVVVGLGGNRQFTNDLIRFADNSGLALALLAPQRNAHVLVLLGEGAKPAPSDIGSGDETLVDLVRPGIWMALTQLALAFLVIAAARGFRKGRVVSEPTTTPISGNQLTLATGNLMHRAQHFDRAGWLIRAEMYRELCSAHNLGPNTAVDQLAFAISRSTHLDTARITELLNRETSSAAALHRLSIDLESLRRDALSNTVPFIVTPNGAPRA